MNIYVGNLSWSMTDDDLQNLFTEHGTVTSAKILKDKMNGRSKGFGFVEMEDDEAAKAAIAAFVQNAASAAAVAVATKKVVAVATAAVETVAVVVVTAAVETVAVATAVTTEAVINI
jgi:RNA recognition motif-containing protein